MALATRPKPNIHSKKKQAKHHRRSKHYLKAYWPYLPMLMVVVIGLAISSLWSNGSLSEIALAPAPTLLVADQSNAVIAVNSVSRIQALTGDHVGWSLVATIALAGSAFALFITRHSLRLHRAFVKGEAFISNYLVFDIVIVFIFTAGFVLTRPI